MDREVGEETKMDREVGEETKMDKEVGVEETKMDKEVGVEETKMDREVGEETKMDKPRMLKLNRIEEETQNEINSELSKPKKKINDFDDTCINLQFFEGDSKWRFVFPIKTVMYTFDTKETHHCNLLLLNMLYKDYNKKENDYTSIRDKLWDAYEPIVKLGSIQRKWKEEKEIKFPEDLETMIKRESYNITLMDMMIFCDFYKIPVIFFTRSKKRKDNKMKNWYAKTSNMTNQEDGGISNNKEGYYYIRIRYHSKYKGLIFSILFYNQSMKLSNYIFEKYEKKYKEEEKNNKLLQYRIENHTIIRNNMITLNDFFINKEYNSFKEIDFKSYKSLNI